MLQNLRKRNEGFTIIEVLIVLAIAGLILLVVFLAVPALQRNSRNTQRKDDIARIGGSVQEFINNNNGTLPVAANNAAIQAQFGTLAYYAGTSVTVGGTGAATNNTTVDTVSIRTGAKCSTGNAVAGTTRQIALLYTVETGSGSSHVCTDL